MRVPVLLTLLLAPAWAGCTQDAASPDEDPELLLFALDGRWPFDAARAQSIIAAAQAPAPVGALALGEAMGARTVGDYVGLDPAAANALGLTPPLAGDAIVTRAWAAREGVVEGASVVLRTQSTPEPYVATYFEMERTPHCERRPDAKLCFLPVLHEGVARLRLRVDEGARDAAFLPDLVELGPGARPAWWNGSFEGPRGERSTFSAHAPLTGNLTLAEFDGPMTAGEWIVSFRLETRHGVAAAGAAGIVRVREPGYLWFDDRLQQYTEPTSQARAVIESATPTQREVRIAGLSETLPLGADIMLHLDDARALTDTPHVTALLVNWTPTQQRALETTRVNDGLSLALRARALPAPQPRADAGTGDITFAAPAHIDLTDLPRIEGAGTPSLALAGRAPIAEDPTLDSEPIPTDLLLLAHAAGPIPWSLPTGARWTNETDALENLSRSRTLALASADILHAPIATARVEIGSGNATRSMVAIGSLTGGPDRALWTSAALVAGSGRPVLARVILPLDAGADREAVIARALEAWGPLGLAFDR